MIVESLCDELGAESALRLQEHLDECEKCSQYMEEMQQAMDYMGQTERLQASIDLDALHRGIGEERNRIWQFLCPAWRIWVGIAVGMCIIAAFTFAVLSVEIQYRDKTLAIRFGRSSREQGMAIMSKADMSSEMDLLHERTAHLLEEHRQQQMRFEKRMTEDLHSSGLALLGMIKAINDYEAQRDGEMTSLLKQMQERQNRVYATIQRELEILALQTQKEFERNYLTMAAMAGSVPPDDTIFQEPKWR